MLQEAKVYQVAVFGSQFFFIGGCYWIFLSINKNYFSIWYFIVAGIHWAFALATRLTIAPVILWSATITIIYIYFNFKPSLRKAIFSLIGIGTPLIIGLILLGWYNWTRFNSISETGISYQLTGTNYMVFTRLFSGSYIGRNFQNYFFHPLKIYPVFPYLFRIEYIFTSERMGGLIFIAPFIVLALIPILSFIWKLSTKSTEYGLLKALNTTEYWFMFNFGGAAMVGLITILSFWWLEMRYLEDFMPSLLLFTIASIGNVYHVIQYNTVKKKIFIFITIILGYTTIIASTLVSLKQGSLLIWMEMTDTILKIIGLK